MSEFDLSPISRKQSISLTYFIKLLSIRQNLNHKKCLAVRYLGTYAKRLKKSRVYSVSLSWPNFANVMYESIPKKVSTGIINNNYLINFVI